MLKRWINFCGVLLFAVCLLGFSRLVMAANDGGYPFRAIVLRTTYDDNGQIVATRSGSILVDKDRYHSFYYDLPSGGESYIQIENRHYVVDVETDAVLHGYEDVAFQPQLTRTIYLQGDRLIKQTYEHEVVSGNRVLSGWKRYEDGQLVKTVQFTHYRFLDQVPSSNFLPVQALEEAVAEKKAAYQKQLQAYDEKYNNAPVSISSGIGIQSVGGQSYNPPEAPTYLNFQGNIATQPGNGISYLANPAAFSNGDISVGQASVKFTDIDLELPGKNGLNLKISRTYNSRNYQSSTKDALYKGQWGGGMGSGWHFGFAKRAYHIDTFTDEAGSDMIVIENGGGSLEYYHGSSSSNTKKGDAYVSKIPSNQNKAYQTDTGIKLVTSAGITLYFDNYFYEDAQSMEWSLVHDYIKNTGYYLSKIEDAFGNIISYEYDKYDSQVRHNGRFDNVYEGLKEAVKYCKLFLLGTSMSHLSNLVRHYEGADRYHFRSTLHRKRLKSITDTFGRKVHISYDDTWKKSPNNRTYKEQVSGIRYTDTSGQTQVIRYETDNNGRLIYVQNGDLPRKQYGYSEFETGLKRYDHFNRLAYGKNLMISGALHAREFDYRQMYDYGSRQVITKIIPHKKYDGYVLRNVFSGMGSEIEYTYTPLIQHGYKYDPRSDDQRASVENDNLATAAPAVIKKTVKESVSGSLHTYRYKYGGQDDKIRNVGKRYMPFGAWSGQHSSYYIPSATVDNPDFLEDEYYEFTAGQLAKKTIGNHEEEHTYQKSSGGDIIRKTKEVYRLAGNITRQVTYDSVDDEFNTTQITRYKGSTPHTREVMTYDTSSTLQGLNLRHLLKTKAVTSLVENVTTSLQNDYNNKGKLSASYDTTGGKRQALKRYSYDSVGRVLSESILGPAGFLNTQYVYSTSGARYQISKRSNGKEVSTIYELNTGLPIETTDENGQKTQTEYDAYGRPLRITYPDASTETHRYSSDMKTHTLSYLGKTVTKKADGFGRIIEVDYSSSRKDEKVDYYFADKPSKLYSRENGAWVLKQSVTYDKKLRPLSVTHQHFGTTRYSYNDSARTQTTTDHQGRSSTVYYDELSQTTQTETRLAGEVSVDLRSQYTINGLGKATNFLDPRGLNHAADYDEKGRLIRTYHTYKTAGKRKRSEMSYHDSGEIKETKVYDKSGKLFERSSFTYDIEGRITAYLHNGKVKERSTYDTGVNAKGRVTKVDTPSATHTYTYDKMGRSTQEVVINKAVTGNRSTTHAFTYDSRHNLGSSSFPDGTTLDYAYDDEDRLKTVTYKGKQLVAYTYTSDGKVKDMVYGNGTKTRYSYIKDILVNDIEIIRADGSALYNEDLRYDSAAKITQTIQTDTVHPNYQFAQAGAETPNRNIKYTYNGRDELAAVDYNELENIYSYQYDNNSNWITFANKKENGSTTADQLPQNFFPDDNSDQLERRDYKDGYVTLKYDAKGNLIEKATYETDADTSPSTVRRFTYNYQGQLTQITDTPSGGTSKVIATYAYDANRHRIFNRTAGQAEQIYHWQGDTHIATGTPQKAVTEKYVYSGNEKIAIILKDAEGNEDLYYLHNNLQGSTMLITDKNQDIRQRTQLDPFGNIEHVITQANLSDHIYYTGKAYDHTTGLYYFQQRYYDADLGRFLTEDPAGQYINPYLYGANNPLSYVDPNGELFSAALFFKAVLTAAATSAAVNATMQYIHTGTVNWDSVGQSALSGAVSGGIFYGIGSFAQMLELEHGITAFATGHYGKVALHALGGGLTSQMMGGDFTSGAIGAGVSQGFARWTQHIKSDVTLIAASAGVGGISSFAAGGSFFDGAMAAGFGAAFNEAAEGHGRNKGTKAEQPMKKAFRSILKKEYNLTPKEFIAPAQNAYNKLNLIVHSPYTSVLPEIYIAGSTTLMFVAPITIPVIAPTIPIAIGINTYLDTVPFGGSFPKW